MVDLHTHILPEVDDGAADMDEALRMTMMAYESGTEYLVLTPHCGVPDAERSNYWSREMADRYRTFRQCVKDAGIPIRIGYGAEVFATAKLPELLKQGSLLTLAGSRYLLIEFSFDASPETIRDALRTVHQAGLVPVLAHPERYRMTSDCPGAIYDWVKSGCIIQMNRDSVTGRFGRSVEDCAHMLLRAHLVHCVASDAHHADFRSPDLTAAERVLVKQYGGSYARLLLKENPLRVITNRELVTPEALPLP